jgi:hypothetical protein
LFASGTTVAVNWPFLATVHDVLDVGATVNTGRILISVTVCAKLLEQLVVLFVAVTV